MNKTAIILFCLLNIQLIHASTSLNFDNKPMNQVLQSPSKPNDIVGPASHVGPDGHSSSSGVLQYVPKGNVASPPAAAQRP